MIGVLRMVVITAAIGMVFAVQSGWAAAGASDDQQTDPEFVKSCLPLVENQWQFHQFRQQYQSTHVLYAQTGPDFFTTDPKNGMRISKQDYHIAVAFIRGDGTYDLSFLNCEIKFDGSASISRDALEEQSSANISRDAEQVARIQLSTLALHSWVDPYVDQPGSASRRGMGWQPAGPPIGSLYQGHEDTFPCSADPRFLANGARPCR